MAKRFMIVVGASVVVVRDGKRKSIAPGGGDEFTEDEIRDITAAAPGALRAPINEGGRKAASTDDNDGDDTTAKAAAKPAAKAKPKGKAKAEAKPATPASDDTDAADDDDDEDGDI